MDSWLASTLRRDQAKKFDQAKTTMVLAAWFQTWIFFPCPLCMRSLFFFFNPISLTELGSKVNIKVKLSLQFTSSFCFDAESPAHDSALAHPEDKLCTALLAFFSLLIRSFQELGIVRHIYHCHTQFTSQQPALKLLPITSILYPLHSLPSDSTPMLASRAHREF